MPKRRQPRDITSTSDLTNRAAAELAEWKTEALAGLDAELAEWDTDAALAAFEAVDWAGLFPDDFGMMTTGGCPQCGYGKPETARGKNG